MGWVSRIVLYLCVRVGLGGGLFHVPLLFRNSWKLLSDSCCLSFSASFSYFIFNFSPLCLFFTSSLIWSSFFAFLDIKLKTVDLYEKRTDLYEKKILINLCLLSRNSFNLLNRKFCFRYAFMACKYCRIIRV